jgi:ABC-type transport system involved in multi-copper enzyme maturation permease subunit
MKSFYVLSLLAVIERVFPAVLLGLMVPQRGNHTVAEFLEGFQGHFLISSIFCVLFIVEEFRSRRVLVILSSGISRVDFLLSKAILSCCFYFYLSILSKIVIVVTCSFFLKFGTFTNIIYFSLLEEILLGIVWILFSSTIAVLFRSTGLSLTFVFFSNIAIPAVFAGANSILRAYFSSYFSKDFNLSNFWFRAAFNGLYDRPENEVYSCLYTGILVSVVWLCFFLFCYFWSFTKRDVK